MHRLHNSVISLIAYASAGVLLWLLITLAGEAVPAVMRFGINFLVAESWLPEQHEFGGKAFIFGSIASALLALLGVVPLGVALGVVSNSYLPVCPQWLRQLIIIIVELTASLPSVVIGFWGITVLLPLLNPLQNWLNQQLGWLVLFGGSPPSGSSLLAASLLLVVMTLPLVASLCCAALNRLPPELRNSSMALGLTQWETMWQYCLPAIGRTILSSSILALGRALGETMAVTMVIGNPTRPRVNWSLIQPASTIPSLLANQFPEALQPLHISALMYLAVLLFGITLITNLCAMAITNLQAR
jgi:phosphate transport system permease protein